MKVHSLLKVKHLAGKRVLLRIDANVPIKNGKILDDYKLSRSLPTIRFLIKQKAKVVIISHLGRPAGYDKKLTLRPIFNYLEKKLHQPLLFFDFHRLSDPWNRGIFVSNHLQPGNIMLLENIRFDKDEEENTGVLAKKLAKLADIFVLDGFGVAHRAGASITGIAELLPTYAGLLIEEEINSLNRVVEKPRHPLIVVLGGAKMETKIPLLKNFLTKADYILLGGGIIATYLWHQGKNVGTSLVEKELPREIFNLFKNKKIILPTDVIVGTAKGKKVTTVWVNEQFTVPSDEVGIYDVGPETLRCYHNWLKQARVIVWNGGLGYFEQKPYNKGTVSIAKFIAKETKRGAFSVCGGGETEQLLKELGLERHISLVSTGGGAMLEFLSGKILPGIRAIRK
jgi:3-phosphoglycerate kinase